MATSNRWVLYLFAVVFGLVLIAKGLTLYTDYLWFGSFGQEAVFTTIFWNRVVLGVVVAGLFFAFFYANLRFARKPLPGDVTFIGRRLLPEEEREQIEQYADRALLLFAAVGAVMAGVVASAHWIEWLQYANWVPFNQADPVFGKDAGFYVFQLRFIEYMWQSLYYALVVTFVFSVVVHLYQEAIRLVGNTVQAIPRARAHALGLLAATLLVKIYSYRLAQYDLLFGNASGAFRGGAGWTDIHARLPVLYLLMAASLAAAIIAIVAIRTRNYKLPAGAVAALILLSLLGGTVYPLAMQKLVVVPNELEYERPYIARNIEATNFAYGTHEVEDRSITIRNDITPETIRENWATIENIRLWDHRPLQRTYNQEQALRAYYNFPDVDVDRYMVDGRIRQVMLAPRQLNADKLPGRERWVNRNLKYTHGYGITLAPVNETNAEGRPNYWVHGIPLTVSQDIGIPSLPQQENTPNLGIYYGTATHPRMIERMRPPEQPLTTQQPQAQPGAETPEGPGTGQPATGPNQPRRGYGGTPEDITAQEFVIVNTKEQELHYSRGGEGTGEIDNAYIHYDGTGGVQLSSYFRRFAFFARFFPDVRILFTNLTTHESRIQINRTLPERMQAIAPFMMYDPDPYIVIDEDGSLKWINDAYTISGKYPYSQGLRPLGNYFRNSVKVVCDAYNGTPEYYIVDDTDPLVQCYDKIFPTLFKRGEEMSDHLRSHLRVPQLLFTLQVGVYADYHMKDPEVFYQGEDRWAMPPEIYSFGRRMVEAYYVVMRLPGEEEPEFLIMMPLVLQGQEERNMVAWMAARCDGPNYGELVVYHFPKGQLVYGPWMIESRIGQDPTISSQITLWSQAGSNVIRGNLLVIPLENSLLYVEPLYLEAEDTGLPELRKVILVYGDSIAFSDTIEGALTQIFGDLGVEVELPDDAFEPPTAATPGAESGVLETVRQTLDRILALNRDAEAARARGDVVTYFELNQQQTQLLDQLGQQIEQETGGAINGTGAPAAP